MSIPTPKVQASWPKSPDTQRPAPFGIVGGRDNNLASKSISQHAPCISPRARAPRVEPFIGKFRAGLNAILPSALFILTTERGFSDIQWRRCILMATSRSATLEQRKCRRRIRRRGQQTHRSRPPGSRTRSPNRRRRGKRHRHHPTTHRTHLDPTHRTLRETRPTRRRVRQPSHHRTSPKHRLRTHHHSRHPTTPLPHQHRPMWNHQHTHGSAAQREPLEPAHIPRIDPSHGRRQHHVTQGRDRAMLVRPRMAAGHRRRPRLLRAHQARVGTAHVAARPALRRRQDQSNPGNHGLSWTAGLASMSG